MDKITSFQIKDKKYIIKDNYALPLTGGSLTGNLWSPKISAPIIEENNQLLTEKYVLKSGDTMTGPLTINGGDGKGLLFPLNGNINIKDTNNTILGFVSGTFTLGHNTYPTHFRGSNLEIRSSGNAGLKLAADSASSDYLILETMDESRERNLFLQSGNHGPVIIGGTPGGAPDTTAKLIVNGDIKEGDKKLSEKYVSKTGDTVSGNLIISGNLTVQGTESILNTETVNTKDNIIQLAIGRAENVGITSPAGLEVANYKGTTKTGQLVFKNDGIAYVGDSDDLRPLTTRGTVIDQHIVKWDAATLSITTTSLTEDDLKISSIPVSDITNLFK